MSQLTVAMLRKIFPNCPKAKAELYTPLFNEILPKYQITSAKRLSGFFATLGQESGELKYTSELADGWAYDITVNKKKAKELGNTEEGDGPKYKGHCLIQITGKDNHQDMTDDFGKQLGVDFVKNPKLLTTPRWAVEGAAWFWKKHNLNYYLDNDDFDESQGIVNRGSPRKTAKALPERRAYYHRALKVFPADFRLTVPEPTEVAAPAEMEAPKVEPTAPLKVVETSTKQTSTEVTGAGSTEQAAAVVAAATSDNNVTEDAASSSPVVVKRERPSFASMVQAGIAWVLGAGGLLFTAFKTFFESIDTIPTLNMAIVLGFVLAMSYLGYMIYNRSAERANKINTTNLANAADRTKDSTILK